MENNAIPKIANIFAYKEYVPAKKNTIRDIINNNNATIRKIPNVLPSFIPKDNKPTAKTIMDIKIPTTEKIIAFNISKPYIFSQEFSINPMYAEKKENTMNLAHEGIGKFIRITRKNSGNSPMKLRLKIEFRLRSFKTWISVFTKI